MIELHRIDASRIMRRFYRLDIAPDLFGGFLLMKQWGRIGARGQIKAERVTMKPLPSQPCTIRPTGRCAKAMRHHECPRPQTLHRSSRT
jgi:WGR domain